MFENIYFNYRGLYACAPQNKEKELWMLLKSFEVSMIYILVKHNQIIRTFYKANRNEIIVLP